nr:PREDICTED: uncharacterized protein LOC105680055 [Linepithema humile]
MGRPPPIQMWVGKVRVLVGTQMKYLGLTLDGLWGFEQHFVQIIPKADRMAAALGRLLPNVGGPNVRVRRLYANVVQSVSLYGAPVWADKVLASRRIQAMVYCQQRRLASRIIRSYCTTSFVAATALAGLLPVEFLANSYAEVYRRTRDPDRTGSARLRPGAVDKIRKNAHRRAISQWQEAIADSATGRWTTHVIQPCLPEWVDRRGQGLEFHLTQVLTGHGCFGDYLCRIGKEHTTRCYHCAAGRDSAQHTLAECEAWTGERRALTAVVGEDLSLPALIQAMLEGEEKWRAASDFCSAVMLQKEEVERIRRGEAEEVDSTPPSSPSLSPFAEENGRQRRRRCSPDSNATEEINPPSPFTSST